MTGQAVRGTLGSGIAGLAAVLIGGATSRALLLGAGFIMAGSAARVWLPVLALVAAVVGGWLAVALVDGVAGRINTRIAIGVVAAMTLLTLLSTLDRGRPDLSSTLWQCASLLLGAVVIACRFRITNARRA